MKFNEFKEKIENEFDGKFNQSLCACRIFRCLGKSIIIDCKLGKDASEWSNGIAMNDLMSVSFIIALPDGWTEEDELPEIMVMESSEHEIKTKPENDILYCDYKRISYRRTAGNPEKIIKAFGKFVGKLHEAVMTEYQSENLLADDMELVETKYAA